MDPVLWVLGLVGALLVYSGATGQSPVGEIRAALSGDPSARKRTAPLLGSADTGSAGASPSAGAAVDVSGLSAPTAGPPPTNLVALTRFDGSDYNGYKLRGPAAEAFQAAQARLGRTIPITSAYRDYVSEKARNATNPQRFPIPNYHTAGQAIDVWQGKLSAGQFDGWPAGSDPSTDPQLISALESVGWQRFDPTGQRGEAMHWSIGGRG